MMTSNPPYERLLRVFGLLTEVPAADRAALENLFHVRHLEKGEFYIRAGERPHSLGFVVSGLLRLYYIDREGVEFTKSFCIEDEFAAAYSALLTGERSKLFVQAIEASTLLEADYQALNQIAGEHPNWQVLQRKIAEYLFIKKERREAELLLDDAKTRYLKFLTEYPNLEKRLKQYHIASYLGITPVTLSRIRSQLDQKKN